MYLSMEQQGAFIASFPFALPLGVDIVRFKRSWQSTYDHFDNLRTRIVDEPYLGSIQLVSEPHAIEWLDHKNGRASPNHTFTHGQPLCRFSISLPGADQSPVFTIKMHHAIFDGHTLDHMLRFAREVYDGHPSFVPRPISHAIFVRSVMDPKRIAQGRAFWKNHLDGLQARAFPTLSSTATGLSSHAQRQRMKRFCSVRTNAFNDLTLAIQIQAAWGLLLSFYTRSSDVLFGYTVSGRDTSLPGVDVDVDDIAGPIVTTVPRRLIVQPTLNAKQYLTRVAQTTAATLPHQQLGMHQITQAAGIVAPRSRLQIDYTHDSDEGWLPHLQDESQDDYLTDPLFVQCSIEDASAATTDSVRLTLSIDYDQTCLPEEKADLLLSHFEQVIGQLIAADSTLGHISLSQTLDQRLPPPSEVAIAPQEQVDPDESEENQAHAPPDVDEGAGSCGTSVVYRDSLATLKTMAAQAMRMPDSDVSVDLPWILLGGDSISAMRMVAACRTASCPVSVFEILDCDSLTHLAQQVTLRHTTSTQADTQSSTYSQIPNGRGCAARSIPQKLWSRLSESGCFSRPPQQEAKEICTGDATWMQHLSKQAPQC